MDVGCLHNWDVSPSEAVAIQKRLAGAVSCRCPKGFKPEVIAAADVSCDRFSSRLFAAAAVFTFPDLELIEIVSARYDASFPYVPGLLSFREAPAILNAFRKLKIIPDAAMLDGHGWLLSVNVCRFIFGHKSFPVRKGA